MTHEDVFANRPIDGDTRVLEQRRADTKGIPVLFERWIWDGILGHSCIVPLESIDEAGMTVEDMIALLRDTLEIHEGDTTQRQTDRFLFFNFGFDADVDV